jgi:hypothetical protein
MTYSPSTYNKNATDLRFTQSKGIGYFFTWKNIFSICCSCSYPADVAKMS